MKCVKKRINKKMGFIIVLSILLIVSGCGNNRTSDSQENTEPQQNEIDTSESLTDNTISDDFNGFNEDELKSVKEVVDDYYKDTSFKIESIEHDSDYKGKKKYKKSNIIKFTVTVQNSEDPPRGIILVREDSNSLWEVLSEGY